MKVIALNTWGGRAGKEKLLDFFARYSDTDVFCLQEIWSEPYEQLEGKLAGGRPIDYSEIMTYGVRDISQALSGHTPFFRPHYRDHYGLLMLVKKQHSVLKEGDLFVYKDKGQEVQGDAGNHARNIQYVTLETPNGPRTVINFHGLWTNVGPNKGDNPDRLLQSDNIIAFTKTLDHPFVLCGDFNLNPDTESLKKFENAGLRNLIREFGITSTRTSFYPKPVKFADYAFLSPEIKLNNFHILPDEVSDHAPLFIDFE